MGYSKRVINDLLNHVCIVKVIQQYLELTQRRVNKSEYLSLCPFHTEKTPSFTVTSTKRFYHCFGCGDHGNAIHFVMEYERLDFISAVKKVAEIGKFNLPKGRRPSNKKIRDREKHRHKMSKLK